MDFLQPATWADALSARAANPGATPLAGGTDVMVELNFDKHRPDALLDLTRVPELAEWAMDDGRVRLGAGVTYTRVIAELSSLLPGLAMAARTVGSPQIRNRGTVGGNLGAASPAGDSHPALLAAGAQVEVASARGSRVIPVADFFTGVKRNALAPDELIEAILITPPSGPQQFSKIGTRNAMVIAVAAFGLALHPAARVHPTAPAPGDTAPGDTAPGDTAPGGAARGSAAHDGRTVGTGIGSAAPTPRRAVAAEAFLAGALEEAGLWESREQLPAAVVTKFAALVAAAAAPIDDVRGTAAYRSHALAVMARRTLTWAWHDYRRGGPGGRGDAGPRGWHSGRC